MNNNAYPCFAHFAPNCPICFPTKTAVPTPVSPNAPVQLTSPGPGGPAGALPTPTISTVTSPAPSSTNGINTLDPSVTNGVSSTAAPEPQEADDGSGNKRKRLTSVEYMPYLLPKRKKKTVIDCPVAQHLFRSLRLNNKFFNSGRVLAWGLQPDDPNFRDIHDYVAKGQAHGYGIKILSIIKIVAKARDIESEEIPFDFKDDVCTREKYRMMLWHGTSRRSVASILENGLRLPTYTGSMFGAGIYFADCISKSAQYCRGYVREGADACLFLCDVLLGRVYKSIYPMNHLTSPPPTKSLFGIELRSDSVKGCGRKVPDKTGEKVIDGCVWPLGEIINNEEDGPHSQLSLNYNEYIVYNTKSVRPQFLVKVKFKKEPYYEKIE